MRKICDEMFGDGNFLAQLIWQLEEVEDAEQQDSVSTDHEYIVGLLQRRLEEAAASAGSWMHEALNLPDDQWT